MNAETVFIVLIVTVDVGRTVLNVRTIMHVTDVNLDTGEQIVPSRVAMTV